MLSMNQTLDDGLVKNKPEVSKDITLGAKMRSFNLGVQKPAKRSDLPALAKLCHDYWNRVLEFDKNRIVVKIVEREFAGYLARSGRRAAIGFKGS